MANVPEIYVLNFADAKIPQAVEVKGKEWILFGEENNYPDHLLYLYNKSSKHNAIINGKLNYIFGKGLENEDATGQALIKKANRYGEGLNEITYKCILDAEIFGGYYLQVIWGKGGGIAEFYHIPFQKIRKGKDGQFFFKKDWSNTREKPIEYQPFDAANPQGAQIFAYADYRPGCDVYPLPNYVGSINYIETDIEISKYWHSAIKQGMFPSKMIVMNNGEPPTEEAKKALQKSFEKRFAGAENAGRIMLVFNEDPAKAPIIQDMSATELDKQFTILNETVQQEIYSGHGVTTPALFGIMTSGKLGEANQLQEGYEIFRNTYAELRQIKFEESLNYLAQYAGVKAPYNLQPVDPIGFKLSEAALLQIAPKEWLLEKAGIDATQYQQPADAPAAQQQQESNENLRNMTGRQYQQVMRVVREYSKGKLTEEQARMMLKSSLGLNDQEVDTLLGINQQEFAALPYTEEQVAEMFGEVGEMAQDFLVVDSWEFKGFEQEFAETKSVTEASIVDLIRKNKNISPAEIAEVLKVDRAWAAKKVAELVSRGVIEQKVVQVGEDSVIERILTDSVTKINTDYKPETTEIFVRYTYETKPGAGAPVIPGTRPFCKRLVELSKMYTRSEIERISERVGYSVYDRAGGFWKQPDGTTSPSCRHYWKTNIVVRKKK